MTRQDTHGIPCPRGCGLGGLWPWRKLDAAIISDGEGGLVWIWSCPMCREELRREGFAFPADFPSQTPQNGPRSVSGGIDLPTEG